MNRLLPLALIATGVSASCTSTPRPETDTLVSNIGTESSSKLACSSGELPLCETAATRIRTDDRHIHCRCAPRGLVPGDSYPH
jgi:hypothetical protein